MLAAPAGVVAPAHSGGSVATCRGKGTRTVVTYDDSGAATMTCTVQAPRKGSRVGSTCEKPRANNRHSARCTFEKLLGRFTHVDPAGTNTLVFTGRVAGRPLPAGSRQLRRVPSNTDGIGVAVLKSFTISS